jgi:hypothetical protein
MTPPTEGPKTNENPKKNQSRQQIGAPANTYAAARKSFQV